MPIKERNHGPRSFAMVTNLMHSALSVNDLVTEKERRASNISRTGVHCTTELEGGPQRHDHHMAKDFRRYSLSKLTHTYLC